jgi:hypothetical protein
VMMIHLPPLLVLELLGLLQSSSDILSFGFMTLLTAFLKCAADSQTA